MAVFSHDGIRYSHASPTRFYAWAWHLTDIVRIPTKDSSGNSFPGDHGLMLMVFAAFMWRFAERRIAIWASAFVVLLSAPRIMVGAHWFSDVYMGSLSIALIALPWLLCSPLASKFAGWLAPNHHTSLKPSRELRQLTLPVSRHRARGGCRRAPAISKDGDKLTL